VEVQVFDARGRRIPARRVALAPLASEEVDLGALIGNRRGYGQLALRHDGGPLDVAAQAVIAHRRRGVAFNQGLALKSQFQGARLVGVTDLGEPAAASLLAVANVSGTPRKVKIRAVAAGRRAALELRIGPRQTRLVPLAELFGEPGLPRQGLTDTAVGIEIEHDGARGEALVHGLMMTPDGLAANLRLVEPAKLRANRALSPALRLTADQRPRLALFHLGGAPLRVLPEVHYRVNGGIGTLKLAPVEVAPNGVRGLELTPALAALPPGSRDLGLRKFGDSHQLAGAAT